MSPPRVAPAAGSRDTSEDGNDANGRETLEISLASAAELCRLGLGTMIDVRQVFEVELKGAIPGSLHIPLVEVKRMLGQALSEDEQEILDAGTPAAVDVQGFITTLNELHHAHDKLLLIICNSGRRSVTAARLLRAMGYRRALSVAGGFQGWKVDRPALTPPADPA